MYDHLTVIIVISFLTFLHLSMVTTQIAAVSS